MAGMTKVLQTSQILGDRGGLCPRGSEWKLVQHPVRSPVRIPHRAAGLTPGSTTATASGAPGDSSDGLSSRCAGREVPPGGFRPSGGAPMLMRVLQIEKDISKATWFIPRSRQ